MTADKCPKCGCTSLEAKHKGPHIGWYCTKCGAWVRWIKQNKKKPEPHQISINEWMQQNAPEQAAMKDDERTVAYFGDVPWEE